MCPESVVRALMIVKESNSQISQQRPVDIYLSHRELQTLRLQDNAGIAVKNVVSTHHVYSAIFYRIIVLRVALLRMSQSRTYLELQLRTRTYSTILYLFITAPNVIFLRPLRVLWFLMALRQQIQKSFAKKIEHSIFYSNCNLRCIKPTIL